MAVKVREKPTGSGAWWIFINHQGRRKSKKIGTDEKLAHDAAKKIEAKLTLGDFGVMEDKKQRILFKVYAKQWLGGYVVATCKHTTYLVYKRHLQNHLLSVFGSKPLASITRSDIKAFLLRKIQQGINLRSLKGIKAVLSTMFTQAVEDGHVESNPATGMGKLLKAKDQSLDKEISPLTAAEVDQYLETCQKNFPEHHPLFLTLARTGMRLGEALGLQWGDIDFSSRFIEIKRARVENRITTPKSGKIRRVKMTPQLTNVLQGLRVRHKQEKLKKGWKELPEWVFVNGEGKTIDPGHVRGRIHYKVCEKAGLRRVRIHDLRHSYATLRISAGHNIADVQKQLGHSSIKITVDTYYHWIPSEQKNEVDDLDNLAGEAHPNAPYAHPENETAEKD